MLYPLSYEGGISHHRRSDALRVSGGPLKDSMGGIGRPTSQSEHRYASGHTASTTS
jgi:hypothetical protein